MIKNNSVIEDALFQIKNLEESLNKNAQGILSSTMRREIGSLVKESLLEQDEVEDDEDVDVDVSTMDDLEDIDADTDNLDDVDDDDDFSLDVDDTEDDMMDLPTMDSDEDTIDLTKASDAEVLRVFKAMGDEDGVIVKKENNMLHLSDNENDTEYLIQLGESDMPMRGSMRDSMMDDMPMRGSMRGSMKDDPEYDYEDPFGDEFGDEFGNEDDYSPNNLSFDEFGDDDYEDRDGFDKHSSNKFSFDEFGEEEDPFNSKNKSQETIYELELDDDGLSGDRHPIEFKEMDDYDMSDNEDRYVSDEDEIYPDDMPTDEFLEGWMNEAKMKAKAKGMGMGNASKFRYDKKPNQSGGFKTTMKQGTRGVGMGKAKFEYKEEVNDEGFGMKPKPRGEFKESSRTLGNGKRWGREGLDKPKAAPRHLRKESTEELDLLRAKNGEYRKALDLFRTKLNEVAVFNSNLAYATRLFTEHSTTKQEKINILRRFDNAETLKESKNLYKYIKGELSEVTSKGDGTITESVQRTISRVPTTGSAVNLIESKMYENPQFLRMKDLMGKLG